MGTSLVGCDTLPALEVHTTSCKLSLATTFSHTLSACMPAELMQSGQYRHAENARTAIQLQCRASLPVLTGQVGPGAATSTTLSLMSTISAPATPISFSPTNLVSTTYCRRTGGRQDRMMTQGRDVSIGSAQNAALCLNWQDLLVSCMQGCSVGGCALQ